MTTVVVNIKKTKDYDVYIGRRRPFKNIEDGYFGNPFIMNTNKRINDGTREEVVEKFRVWFYGDIPYKGKDPVEYRKRAENELKGKRLGCFCKPEICHGDVIVEWLDS